MIPPAFEYLAPRSVAEAVEALGRHEHAKILAGGQSLIPLMRFRLAEPGLLVDINRIQELAYIREDGNWLKIGAMTRETELERSALIQEKYPLLADTARLVADPLVRNLSTIGGNLAHADPANDHPATMLAYDAEVEAVGPNGSRTIPIQSFFVSLFESALAPTEILTEIRIPAAQPNSGGAYFKLERKVGDFATVAVAAQVRMNQDGTIAAAGLGLTNVGLTPIKVLDAEAYLVGKAPNEDHLRTAAQMASEAAEPENDHRGSEAYKRSLVRTYTIRALRRAIEKAQGG